MSETSTQAPQQERSRDLAHLPFAEQVQAASEMSYRWYVPDVDDLVYYGGLVSGLEATQRGKTVSYREHDTGDSVDTDQAERLIKIANPNYWCLDEKTTKFYDGIASATSERQLTDSQYDWFRVYKRGLPRDTQRDAFANFRRDANAILDLSDELHDIQAKGGPLPVPKPVTASTGQQNRQPHGGNKAPQPVDPDVLDTVRKFVDLDSDNEPLRPDGTKMSQYEFDLITENLDKVLNEIEGRESEVRRRQLQKRIQTKIHGPEEYQRRFGNKPEVDPDAYLATFKATDPNAIVRGKTRPDLPEEVFSENKPASVEQAFWDKLDGATKQAWNGNVLPDASKQKLQEYFASQPNRPHQRGKEANDNFTKWYERQIVAAAKELYPKNYRVTPEQRAAIGARANEISDGKRLQEYRAAEADRLVETYNKRLDEIGSSRRRLTAAQLNRMDNAKLWELMVELWPDKYGREAQDKVHNAKGRGRGVGPVPRPTAWETVGDTNLHWSGEGDLDIPPKQRLHRRIGKAALRHVPFRVVRRT